MTDQPTITVDGHAIPLLGFGTWNLEPEDARRMVAEAIRIGYRHIDTAWIYKNEAAVGDGIRDAIATGHVAREDIWLTTKIWVRAARPRAKHRRCRGGPRAHHGR